VKVTFLVSITNSATTRIIIILIPYLARSSTLKLFSSNLLNLGTHIYTMFDTTARMPSFPFMSSSSYIDIRLEGSAKHSNGYSSTFTSKKCPDNINKTSNLFAMTRSSQTRIDHISKGFACLGDDDDDDDNVSEDTESLMSSINLEDSSSFMDLSDSVPSTEEHSKAYSNKVKTQYESILFDAERQQFEWRDDVSLLKQLRVTRLSTLWEEAT